MLRLVIQRVIFSTITLAIVGVIIFVAVEALPGDMATAYLGRESTPQKLAFLRGQLGLNEPAYQRFGDWFVDIVRFDFGFSLARNEPVRDVISTRLRNTLLLGITSAAVGIPLALGLGVLAGLARDRPADLAISTIAMIAMTLPGFATGTMLILLFAITWSFFPAVVTVGSEAPIRELLPNIVLPVATLTLVMVAHILRMIRTSVIEVMASDYVQMAILKGTPYWTVVWKHALPNALLPAIQIAALTVAWLIDGLVIIEVVFNYPGIGTLILDSIHNRDIPMVQGIALVSATVYIVCNLSSDFLNLVLNPRLRSLRA
jgi:peptide/nickel transport system permease protein